MHILILVHTIWMEIIVYMLDGCMLFSMARIYALQSLYETNLPLRASLKYMYCLYFVHVCNAEKRYGSMLK